MICQWNNYIYVTIAASLLSLGGAVVMFQLKARGMLPAVFYQIFAALWNIAYSVELSRCALEEMILWDKVCMVGAALTPLFFLLYAAEFTGLRKIYRPWWISLLSFIPGIFVLLTFTNESHHLIFANSWVVDESMGKVLAHIYGPALWAYYSYGTIISLTSIAILIIAARRSAGFYERHSSVMIIGALIPVLAALIHFIRVIPTYITGTSVGMTITGTLVTLSFIRLNRGEILRVSKSAAFDDIAHGIIVLDEKDRIIEISDKALQVIGRKRQEVHLKVIDDVLLRRKIQVSPVQSGGLLETETEATVNDRILNLQVDPLLDWRKNLMGKIVTLHDVTQERIRSNELSLLLEASRATASALDLNTILQTLAKHLLEISGFHHCEISEWDRDSGMVNLRLDHSRIYKKEGFRDFYKLGDYPLSKNVLLTGDPLILQGDFEAEEKEWMDELGRKALVALPLIGQGEVMGLVEIAATKSYHRFTEPDLQQCRQLLSEAETWLKIPITNNPPERLVALADALARVSGGDVCSISDWKRGEDRIDTIVVTSDIIWESGQGPSYTPEQYEVIKAALMEGSATEIIRDENDPSIVQFMNGYAIGAQSFIVLPLQKGSERIGLIELFDFNDKKVVSPDKIALLRAVADQAGFLIYNARLNQITKKNLEEQIALRTAANAISSSLSHGEVLTEICRQMAISMDATSSYFVTYNEFQSRFEVVAEYISPQACQDERASELQANYGREVGAWVFSASQNNKAFAAQVDDESLEIHIRNRMRASGGKSILYIPLYIKDRLSGYAEIWESRWRREFTHDEIQVCEAIAQQAVIAIQNVNLYEQAKQSEAYYRNLFENAHDAILIIDPVQERILDVNQRACNIYDYRPDKLIGLSLSELATDINHERKEINHLHAQGDPHSYETTHLRRDGTKMFLEINTSLIEYRGQNAVMSLNRDITQRKMIEEKLRHSALHDNLTGLPNRSLFLNRLRHALATRLRNEDFIFAVIFLDLDNFKKINDSLGHSTGDAFLQITAQRLGNAVREVDTVARFGGDEFVMLVESCHSPDDILTITRRILNLITRPIDIGGQSLATTTSAGIVFGNQFHQDEETLLRDADIALYQAKGKGGNRFEVFDEKMKDHVLHWVNMEKGLADALKKEEFLLHYQPVFCLKTGKLHSLEALLRWQKTKSLIYPNDFIPIAEKTGLIHPIGDWVIESALRQIQTWKERYPFHMDLRVSVNLSSRQLERPDFAETLLSILERLNASTEHLSLEVTESSIIENIELSGRTLETISNHGIQVDLDDFGTGYSSLYYLSKLPIDTIKIDRSFIHSSRESQYQTLIKAMIGLGHELGKRIIAEGVETQDQMRFLQQNQCDFGQGYFFRKPVDGASLEQMIARGVWEI
jgi:diguanylate cyclase (GGDEF)-like protein/PAS domain S-box-containing protein